MKIGSVIPTALIAAACAVGGWAVHRIQSQVGSGEPSGAAAPAEAVTSVAVRSVELRPYNVPDRYVAHAEAVQEVELLPQVDGYVREITFRESDLVKEGQLLCVLDDERYRAVANQRKADLAAAAESSRAAVLRKKAIGERRETGACA